jgi:hypothetical protein
MKRMLEGKKLVWKRSTGKMVAVVKEKEGGLMEERGVNLEMIGGTVEIEREEKDEETEKGEGRGLSSREIEGGWADMEFLEGIDIGERDKELDEKMGEGKKRKRGDEEERDRRLD